MKPHLILILAALAASGCASSPSGRLPVCDGKHLRPANPNGSVLDPSTPAAAPVTPSKPAPADGQPGCDA
jgi:type IV secretion system protein VirB7